MSNETIQGLSAVVGKTDVFAAAMPQGWFIRLVTEGHVTSFCISPETLECVLALLMRQGGFVIPGAGFRVVAGKHAGEGR